MSTPMTRYCDITDGTNHPNHLLKESRLMERLIGLPIHWTYCKIYTCQNLHCSKWAKISRLCERKNCCSACILVNKSRHLRKKLLILWARLLLGMSMEIKICFPIQILIKIIIIILYWSVLTFFKLVLYFFMKCKQGARVGLPVQSYVYWLK